MEIVSTNLIQATEAAATMLIHVTNHVLYPLLSSYTSTKRFEAILSAVNELIESRDITTGTSHKFLEKNEDMCL